MTDIHHAVPCGCGDNICNHWHVSPQAVVQGVSFTKSEAEFVAGCLNAKARIEEKAND